MFKFNKKHTRKTVRRSGVFILNFEHTSHFFSSVSIVDFDPVNASWGNDHSHVGSWNNIPSAYLDHYTYRFLILSLKLNFV